MKRVGLIATIVIAAMLIAGCGNSNNIDNKTTVNESLAVSSSVGYWIIRVRVWERDRENL